MAGEAARVLLLLGGERLHRPGVLRRPPGGVGLGVAALAALRAEEVRAGRRPRSTARRAARAKRVERRSGHRAPGQIAGLPCPLASGRQVEGRLGGRGRRDGTPAMRRPDASRCCVTAAPARGGGGRPSRGRASSPACRSRDDVREAASASRSSKTLTVVGQGGPRLPRRGGHQGHHAGPVPGGPGHAAGGAHRRLPRPRSSTRTRSRPPTVRRAPAGPRSRQRPASRRSSPTTSAPTTLYARLGLAVFFNEDGKTVQSFVFTAPVGTDPAPAAGTR